MNSRKSVSRRRVARASTYGFPWLTKTQLFSLCWKMDGRCGRCGLSCSQRPRHPGDDIRAEARRCATLRRRLRARAAPPRLHQRRVAIRARILGLRDLQNMLRTNGRVAPDRRFESAADFRTQTQVVSRSDSSTSLNLRKWYYGAEISDLAQAKLHCGVAGFGKTILCGAVTLTNDSNERLRRPCPVGRTRFQAAVGAIGWLRQRGRPIRSASLGSWTGRAKSSPQVIVVLWKCTSLRYTMV